MVTAPPKCFMDTQGIMASPLSPRTISTWNQRPWLCHPHQRLPTASPPHFDPQLPLHPEESSGHSPATGPCQWPHSPELTSMWVQSPCPQGLVHGSSPTPQATAWYLLSRELPQPPGSQHLKQPHQWAVLLSAALVAICPHFLPAGMQASGWSSSFCSHLSWELKL